MKNKGQRRTSIKVITALYSILVITFLTIAIVFTGYRLFEKKVTENYEKYASTVLNYAYSITEDYDFGDMIAAREMSDEYEEMREDLNSVKENSDIGYLYAIYFEDINDIHSLHYAINTKTKEELENGGKYTNLGTPCEDGSFADETVLILQEAVKERQKDSGTLVGESEEYGHMLNGYRVIYDSSDEPAGILCVEIDINNINKDLNRYVREIVLFVAIFTLVIILLYIVKIEYSLLYPITSITRSARDFIRNIGDQKAMDENAQSLERLNIRSNNEVGELYETVCKMEKDIAKQLGEILKMQNGLMVLMADIVEVRDSDTGAHIQKTAEYVKIILDGLRRKGYFKEILTDRYVEDVIKSAPLHDIGKITIPDNILNKPDKLTAEEFRIMKTHTTSGRDIIDKAIRRVEGENFLQEARNMAAYHHEQWNGKGYPEGLSGEEIPLSARIMAIADVFDAWTSPRVYKPAFRLSEAVAMIREADGVRFDPKCTEVFLEALPEVEQVLKRLNPDYKEE